MGGSFLAVKKGDLPGADTAAPGLTREYGRAYPNRPGRRPAAGPPGDTKLPLQTRNAPTRQESEHP